MITPVTITKKEAAAIVLEKALEGRVKGGAYLRDRDHAGTNAGDRCSIGWLFPEESASKLEYAGSFGCEYLLVSQLIERKLLITDDPSWFMDLQNNTDMDRLGELGIVIKMCREALEE